MLRTIDLRGRLAAGADVDYAAIVPRAEFDVDAAVEVVRPICADVAVRGAAALAEYSERFDHVVPPSFRVPTSALAAAAAQLDPELRAAFDTSIERRRLVSFAELGVAAVEVPVAPGALVTQRMVPMGRVGLYVPGGLAPLASSVIMNVVPAQVAGVQAIALASPPQADFGGLPHPGILALCHILGIDEVYAVGGAQAIAMFAYGVPDLCAPVNLITGPGNIYVVAAKRLLKGRVNIDSEAGPTEIVVLADHSADPVHVAADLISQAEHDPLAASVLVTDSPALADGVRAELLVQLPETKHVERITTSLHGRQSAVVLVDDVDQGIEVVNAYAAEHLEIQTVDAEAVAAKITNAGAIFVGAWSPVSLGDYCAGSTHVLPTAGCACHSSGLNVKSFLKAMNVINYSRAALSAVARSGRGVRGGGGSPGPRRRGDPAVPVTRSASPATADPRLADLPLRPELVGEVPYGAPQLAVPVCLNVNENPYPPSEIVVAEMAAAVALAARSMNRYPERDALALRADLARYLGHGLGAEQIWAANGSNEVMLHVLSAFAGPGRLVLSFAPTYSMYPEYARDTHSGWLTFPRRDDFTIDPDSAVAAVREHRPDVVLITSPNNPTGTAVDPETIIAICDAAPGVVVVDEAYVEFARTGTPSALDLLPRYPRLAVSRTMSKAFAFAGGRLGYLAAAPAFVDALRIVRLPYHLSAVTQAVARVALAHADQMLAAVDQLRAARDDLARWLSGLGLDVADSDANFVLFGRFADRHAVWQGLLDQGVLIREVGPDGWLGCRPALPMR